jgi:hypothetical protein
MRSGSAVNADRLADSAIQSPGSWRAGLLG